AGTAIDREAVVLSTRVGIIQVAIDRGAQRELVEAHLPIRIEIAVVVHLESRVNPTQVGRQAELRGLRIGTADGQEAKRVAQVADAARGSAAPSGELERVLVHVDGVTTQGNTEGVLTRQAKRSVPVLLLGLQADGQVKLLGDVVLPKELVTLMPRRRRELSVERRRRRKRDTRERKHERESQCERLSHFANSP